MLLLYRKAMRCVGMGQHFLKNKKLFTQCARNRHTSQGPTPPPSRVSCEPFAIDFAAGICVWPFGLRRVQCAGTFFLAGWFAALHKCCGSCGSCGHLFLSRKRPLTFSVKRLRLKLV